MSHAIMVSPHRTLPFKRQTMKIVEFANRVDPDEVAHPEPPHMYLHCLHSSL